MILWFHPILAVSVQPTLALFQTTVGNQNNQSPTAGIDMDKRNALLMPTYLATSRQGVSFWTFLPIPGD
jgi:hypothetical protein